MEREENEEIELIRELDDSRIERIEGSSVFDNDVEPYQFRPARSVFEEESKELVHS